MSHHFPDLALLLVRGCRNMAPSMQAISPFNKQAPAQTSFPVPCEKVLAAMRRSRLGKLWVNKTGCAEGQPSLSSTTSGK